MCSKNSIYTNYKSLARRVVFAVAFLLLMMINVNAETITYNVCKNGCEYSELNNVISDIGNISNNSNVIINLKDNETYDVEDFYIDNEKIESLQINGDNSTISSAGIYIYSFKKVDIENVILNSEFIIQFRGSNENIEEIESGGKINGQFNISNSVLNVNQDSSYGIIIALGNVKITNSIINSFINFGYANVVAYNSTFNNSINEIFIGGGLSTATNVHIYSSNIISQKVKRERPTNELLYNDSALIEFLNDPGKISELKIEDYIGEEFNFDISNNIYYYQEASKTIKADTPISALSEGFVDTYKDSIGYDDIKNLPVEWKSQDEAIVKVEGDSIKVVNPGIVDVVGTKGNDIYTIHLTVESSNSGTIEKKEQRENNYAEADFSSEDLNSIIPLTSDEQAIKESGKNIEVFLEVKDISSNISSEDQKMIDSKLETNEVLGAYLDVSLFKQVEGQDATKIEETNGNIKVSMKLPDSLLNKDKSKLRTYYILRLHNGVVDKLETELNGDTLTFETNKFSTYALVYEDINNPQTGDNIIKYLIMMIGCILTIIVTSNIFKERRNR